jgi:hypothetical protein
MMMSLGWGDSDQSRKVSSSNWGLLRFARNDGSQCRRQHHAEDGDDDTQMQKQITSRDHIIQPKYEWQNVIEDDEQNADQR